VFTGRIFCSSVMLAMWVLMVVVMVVVVVVVSCVAVCGPVVAAGHEMVFKLLLVQK